MAKIHTVFLKIFTTLQYQYRFFNIALAIAACLGAMFFAMEVLEPRSIYIIAGVLCCFTLYQDCRYFGTVNTESIYLDYADLEIMQGSYEMGKAEYLPVATDMDRLTREVHGTFHTAFYEPWSWRIAEVISILTLFFIIYYLIPSRRKGVV